jgi:prolyl-tRNA synthetase
MGSYGIGISRLLGVIVEVFSDEKGIVWPESVAPFKYHLVSIANSEDDESYKKSEELYFKLKERGDEVLWDDRIDVRAGEKFADADLIGCPIRLLISPKTLEQDSVEIKLRSEEDPKLVKLGEI